MNQADPAAHARNLPRFAEFVTMIATLMALTALSIDVMLPALPQIRADFGLADPNRQQLVITSYVVGFAIGQLFHGPISDALGRRPVLIAGLAVYAGASFACLVAGSFAALLAARVAAGAGERRAAGRRHRRRARRLWRAAHGRGDVLRDDGVHRRADPRPGGRRASSCSSAAGT